MKVIALDTTTRGGSVALLENDRVIDELSGDAARTHAERLPADIVSVARAHDVALADVSLFAVATGPGSFTGLRIGIATIQGLAAVGQRRIVGVSALEALAQTASVDLPAGTTIATWMDAHRGEVFAALYRVTAAAPFSTGRLDVLEEATVGDPLATLDRWAAGKGIAPKAFVGDGAVLYADAIGNAAVGAAVLGHPPLAAAIGRMAVGRAVEAMRPGDLRPIYVRRPDAEIARDRA